jgi:hypothetical protein
MNPISPSSSQLYNKNKKATKPQSTVNKTKVFYGMIWYAGSLLGYFLMEKFHQGLDFSTSKEMFFFTASETLFMVSMAMSFFFSY